MPAPASAPALAPPIPVLVVGSGPTGLTLTIDLARRGVGVRIIDKSARFPRRTSRSRGWTGGSGTGGSTRTAP
ncbi:FAD-dependent monooxygenase [Streptomyces sp. A1277]|uniref:FAD-dependent monooxygenase n=1 Tax=Streptomyces sp. A1277 TaxID=2563103 RepID=UPI001F10E09E|nr:FAD-dependent monooxygenase [Streptomyces sp. A1277]